MARSVTYSVVPRTKPGEKNDPPKYYAQAQARGDVSIREMAERIQATCTVHKTDVYAVLTDSCLLSSMFIASRGTWSVCDTKHDQHMISHMINAW